MRISRNCACTLFLAVVTLPGCRPGASYVAAERLTYEAIAPEYVAYVASDTTLSSDERENRYGTVRSWEARLEQAETPAGGAE